MIEVTAPASKSFSHRYLIAAALASGTSTIHNVLDSNDTTCTREILSLAGAKFTPLAGGSWQVQGTMGKLLGGKTEPLSCYVHESGTSCRLLTAVLASGRGNFRIHGAPRMHERPMGFLVNALRALGCEDVCADEHAYVTGRLAASAGAEDLPALVLCAHIDSSPDAPASGVRPHIVRSYTTGKYVLWAKFSHKSEFCFAVLTADSFKGPYTLVKEYYKPFDAEVGDFDIHDFGERGTYIYFADGKKGIIASRLTDDCTALTGEPRLYYENRTVPYCREGVTVFEAKGNIYLLTSGMTGYVPNPSEVAMLSAPLGELRELGDPHIDDKSGASFQSQISCIFENRKTGTLVALADRWVPDLQLEREQHLATLNAIAACCDPKHYHASMKDIMGITKLPMDCKKVNTSLSDYVILPVEWEGEKPVLRWKEGGYCVQ